MMTFLASALLDKGKESICDVGALKGADPVTPNKDSDNLKQRKWQAHLSDR
jgi:hypothetical protein